jgi:AcrR family transcriptional regulator
VTTRDRILDAAAHIMRHDGIARATTKEIAQQAGFSEATLYKHFANKTEIFVAVLQERAPGLAEILRTLDQRVGQGTVAQGEHHVVDVAQRRRAQARAGG